MIFRIQTQYNNNKKACRLSMNDLRTTINKQNKLNRVKKKTGMRHERIYQLCILSRQCGSLSISSRCALQATNLRRDETACQLSAPNRMGVQCRTGSCNALCSHIIMRAYLNLYASICLLNKTKQQQANLNKFYRKKWLSLN